MPVSNNDLKFFTAAQAFTTKGYAVIPLWGEACPERTKVAAVEWGIYQRRKPTQLELRQWFIEKAYSSLAIVTGRISGICVLDLDSQHAFDLFRQSCPDLVERHIIKTRRGYHVYFRIPPHLHLPSRKVPEADWLADGRYVVARPTPGYKLVKGGEPKQLDQYDLNRITAFLDLLARTGVTATASPFESAPVTVNTLPVSAHALVGQYRYLAPQIGRNEALFRVSLKARDHGWTVDDTITLLADLHARQPSIGEHVPEHEANRRKEAVATIVSAFSRPSRPVQTRKGLPVSVCEALYALRLTCVVRVITALRERGVDDGSPVSYTQARRLLRGSRVGKWSLLRSLNATLPDGERVFSPSDHPLASNDAASNPNPPHIQKNAFLKARQNRKKVPAHRPQAYLIMPSDAELCQRLGVRLTQPDPMTTADRASARQTRLASHRELIARRPGQYPNQWLAKRLRVSTRTIQRYQKQITGLQVTPVYTEVRLHWGNLNVLPDDTSFKGAFLEDEKGKKYPPIAGVAAKLLAKGRRVSYRRQQANYYCMVSPTVSALQTWALEHPLVIVQPRCVEPLPTASPAAVLPTPIVIDMTGDAAPIAGYQVALPGFFPFRPSARSPVPAPKQVNQRVYKRPLADTQQEALAQQVYQAINSRTTEKAHRISLMTARRLIASYQAEQVERALKLMARRNHLTKPTGFFITVLRCEVKYGKMD